MRISELVSAYLAHLDRHYARHPVHGHTNEAMEMRYAAAPLLQLYPELDAAQFSRPQLKAVRECMSAAELSNATINSRVAKIKRMFRWAEDEELMDGAVWARLASVRRLPQRAYKPKPVPLEEVLRTLPHCWSPVKEMILVQLLGGMRPGEVVQLRLIDVDRTVQPWTYRPRFHKSLWRGLERVVYLPAQAQEILAPLIAHQHSYAHLFRPSSVRRNNRYHTQYTTRSYGQAVRRACARAGTSWHVHQLRHAAASFYRSVGGLELAQRMLGHESQDTTEIYAALPASGLAIPQMPLGEIPTQECVKPDFSVGELLTEA
jgi:integrase